MLASARCGSALLAWPAESSVATQVVRRRPLKSGSSATRAAAFVSFGLLAKAAIALPISPPFCGAIFAKNVRVISLDSNGN
jgi:hypothetical protein